VPPDAKDDKALKTADDLLHGIKSTAATQPAAPATGDKAAIDKPANKAAN
jgi:carboxyl-terminal processing protease